MAVRSKSPRRLRWLVLAGLAGAGVWIARSRRTGTAELVARWPGSSAGGGESSRPVVAPRSPVVPQPPRIAESDSTEPVDLGAVASNGSPTAPSAGSTGSTTGAEWVEPEPVGSEATGPEPTTTETTPDAATNASTPPLGIAFPTPAATAPTDPEPDHPDATHGRSESSLAAEPPVSTPGSVAPDPSALTGQALFTPRDAKHPHPDSEPIESSARPSPTPRRRPTGTETEPRPGSVPALPDGSAPGPEYTIKGNAGSMLFHRPDSPYYARTKAEVWFRTATDARAAGFTEWVPKNRAAD